MSNSEFAPKYRRWQADVANLTALTQHELGNLALREVSPDDPHAADGNNRPGRSRGNLDPGSSVGVPSVRQ